MNTSCMFNTGERCANPNIAGGHRLDDSKASAYYCQQCQAGTRTILTFGCRRLRTVKKEFVQSQQTELLELDEGVEA